MGLRLLMPRQVHCLHSGTSAMDARDSHPEADHQQKSSIYQVAGAVTDPGVTPAQVTIAPRMKPPPTLHIPKIKCSSKFWERQQVSAKQSARQELNNARYTCAYLPVGCLPLSMDPHINKLLITSSLSVFTTVSLKEAKRDKN